MNLGEKIGNQRKKRGFSQELLADNSGISLRTIQRIENSQSKPRPYTLKVLADTLNIDIEELAGEQNDDRELLADNNSLAKINLINSSALLGILIPFFNIIAPVIFWKLNKENPLVNEKGRKVISFQIIWVLFSILILLIAHFVHYKIMGEFISGRIPFVVVVYILLLLLNVIFIIKSSIELTKKRAGIYSFIPNMF